MPVFISYSHEDSEFALKLASQLVEHRTWVWIDKWELKVGDSIIENIQNAIEGASALIIVLSKNSVNSEWCKKEINTALMRELDEKRVIILPVLIENCKIPIFLKEKHYADFRNNYDEGFKDVMEAIASITSQTLGRHEDEEKHMDWSIEYGIYPHSNTFEVDITIVEQAQNEPFTILTRLSIITDEFITQRYNSFEREGLGWFYRSIILSMVAQIANNQEIRILLKAEKAESTRLILNDPNQKISFETKISSRRLGSDTGKNILVDVANQISEINQALLHTLRPLTEEEQRKWDRLKS